MTENIPPGGLAEGGLRLWSAVVEAFTLDVGELEILRDACRLRDVVDAIDLAMRGESLVVRGSMGQSREHPLLSEGRASRMALAGLIKQLKLPADEQGEASAALTRSEQARGAALVRHHGKPKAAS